jgi:hypothetical protein
VKTYFSDLQSTVFVRSLVQNLAVSFCDQLVCSRLLCHADENKCAFSTTISKRCEANYNHF